MTDDSAGCSASPAPADEDDHPPPESAPRLTTRPASATSTRSAWGGAFPALAFASAEVPTAIDLPVSPALLLCIGLSLTFVASLVVHALLKFSPSLLLLRRRAHGRNGNGTRADTHEELEREVQESEVYLPAAVLIELLGITTAAVGALALFSSGASSWPAGWPGIAVFVLLVCLLGRLLPERITEFRSERVVMFSLPVLRVVRILLMPITAPLGLLTKFCIRNVLGIREEVEHEHEREQLADEIRAAVEDSDDSEELADEEKAWIENIVDFRKEDAAGIMTPRTDMICIEASCTLEEAMQKGVAAGHSRLPIFEDKLDAIVGVFYLRDAVAALSKGEDNRVVLQQPVNDHMRDAYFVPESKKVSNLLREFRERHLQIAIVVDEYGGTSGLVSIEDILEEIVGEIQDEYDPEVTEEPFEVRDDGRFAECDAKARVTELNEKIAVELPESEDYETLGGFVSSQLGRIPSCGEVFHWENVEFTVVQADARRVQRVKLRVLETESKPSG